MKKIIRILATTMAAVALAGGASATPFYLNLDNTGTFSGAEYISKMGTNGVSYVKNTITGPTNFTFEEVGFFSSTTKNGGVHYSTLGSSEELTGLLRASGSGTLGSSFNFTGGTLELWLGTTRNFGSTVGSYGTNDNAGVKLADFNVTGGSGMVDLNASPLANGQISIAFQSTYLAPSTWFDLDGNDLSLLPSWAFVLGFATTNAITINGTLGPDYTNLVSEVKELIPTAGTQTNLPTEIYIENGGQFATDVVVPEPGTFALLGAGLFGLAVLAKRRVKK